MDEIEKSLKNARHPWMKPKNGENKLSAVAETEKTTKTDFPPRRMSGKQQKQRFGHGRN